MPRINELRLHSGYNEPMSGLFKEVPALLRFLRNSAKETLADAERATLKRAKRKKK